MSLHAQRLPAYLELTDREREVLQLTAAGLTGPQIAKTLFIGIETVRSHRLHIRQKLDANTMAHAVARAYDKHLLGSQRVWPIV